jgi:hypothetical protein
VRSAAASIAIIAGAWLCMVLFASADWAVVCSACNVMHERVACCAAWIAGDLDAACYTTRVGAGQGSMVLQCTQLQGPDNIHRNVLCDSGALYQPNPFCFLGAAHPAASLTPLLLFDAAASAGA